MSTKPTPVFLPGESQGRGSLVGCRLWGLTESDTNEVTASAAEAMFLLEKSSNADSFGSLCPIFKLCSLKKWI